MRLVKIYWHNVLPNPRIISSNYKSQRFISKLKNWKLKKKYAGIIGNICFFFVLIIRFRQLGVEFFFQIFFESSESSET